MGGAGKARAAPQTWCSYCRWTLAWQTSSTAIRRRRADAYSPGAPQSDAGSLAGLTTMALHGRIEVFDQYLTVERLTQEAGCSGFQCLRPNALLGESCDENDRQPVSLRFQKILQLDSAHARHMNIRDHAGCVIQLRCCLLYTSPSPRDS